MPSQFFGGTYGHLAGNNAVVDVTPPTFAGIATLAVGSRGQIVATWLAATDPSVPLRYEVYIQASTATGLFNVLNIVGITTNLQYSTFTLPDGSFLQNGTTYYVGVRAVDAVSNRNTNTVSLNVISTGVYVSSETYEVNGVFSLNASKQLTGTLWSTKNFVLATSSNAVLGTASYEIYTKTGTLVSGMSQTGIAVGTDGQFIITPVNSTLNESLDHYLVKATISIDGSNRVGYIALEKDAPYYDINGNIFVNNQGNIDGTFWITANEQVVTSNLGTASYQIYDHDGNPVSGMSETGITATGAGLFNITPIPSTLDNETNYIARIAITVDGVTRSEIVSIAFVESEYNIRAVFSINASNQFQGTLWAETSKGAIKTGSEVGTASYAVYDSTGTAVVGLTQSGITADVNGRFIITPVSAVLLTDLTHYTVRVSISVDSVTRTNIKGFTLLGT